MRACKDLKKLLICGLSIMTLSTSMININKAHASSTNQIFDSMDYKVSHSSHISKKLQHKFMIVLPRLSTKQLYKFNYYDGGHSLSHHNRAIFNKIYQHKLNGYVNKHAKFNKEATYKIFLHDDINTPITAQDKYNFLKLLPHLSYRQLAKINNTNDEQGFNDCFGHKIGKLLTSLYTSKRNAKIRAINQHEFKRLSKIMSPTELNVAKYDLQDINIERKNHGLPALTLKSNIQRVADMRAKQAYDAFYSKAMLDATTIKESNIIGHGIHKDGSSAEGRDAKALGLGKTINDFNSLENANNFTFGKDLQYSDINDTIYYSATTPKQLARAFNNAYMYHDHDEKNGHRDTILDSTIHHVGIGVKYNSKNNKIATVEDYY